jgi:DNA helicase-2/ATP-dependent DNA helicase PcrA
VKRKINSFVNTIRTLRDLAQKVQAPTFNLDFSSHRPQRTSPADLLRHLLLLIDYAEYLKKTQTDWESRWANVEELINFATEVGLDAEDLARRNVPAERDGGSRCVE